MSKYIDADLLRKEIERQVTHTMQCMGGKITGELVLSARKLLAFLDTLPEQPVEKTCKTCGFYENNCPYIRDKFIPYPNKVCKDYTYSVMKAQEQPVEGLEEEVKKYWNAHALDYRIGRVADLDFMFLCARHFAEWGAEHARKEDK